MVTVPRNYSCFEYSVVFNVPSQNNASNVTIDTYEIRTSVGVEFLLAMFFLFLTVCVLIATGIRLWSYYANRRKNGETYIQ